MKTVVGVDLAGAFEPALQLFRQLKFDGASMHFLNVVEPILPDGSFPELGVMHPIGRFNVFQLRNSNTTGAPDVSFNVSPTASPRGAANLRPVAGDYDGLP